jgi:hypothetical protein
MNNRFNIKLCVTYADGEVWYKLLVYMMNTGSEKFDRLEIELVGVSC